MKLLKKVLKIESGQILPMALVMMVLGGLLIVPILSLMTTNLNTNRQIERNNTELYAADAGIETIIWNLSYNQWDPQENPDGFSLPQDGDDPVELEFSLNDRAVAVEMYKPTGEPLQITSTSTSTDGHSTTIVCRANAQADYSYFFDAAITSAGDVTIKPGTEVEGDVVYDGTLNNQGEIDGDEIHEPSISDNWPSAEYLYDYYYEQVETAPTLADGTTINIAGYTIANPYNLGPAYALGDLNITGKGWLRLNGTLFIEDDLNIQPGCTIDLNYNTIFAANPYPDPYNGDLAINFQPGTMLVGSGCVIGIGDINFKPQLGAGDKIIGVDEDITFQSVAPKDTLLLSRFPADISGGVKFFRVNCSDSGNVKLAMYSDDDGDPGTLLGISNEGDGTSVIEGCNDIEFPETSITAGSYYWLAAIADKAIIRQNTDAGTSKYKTIAYSLIDFYNDPTLLEGLQDATGTTYLLSGNAVPFVFIMSVEGESTVSPGGTIYGSIAGDAEVYLAPHNSLTLTDVPAEGLEFPGMMPGGGTGVTGTPPVVLSYSIQ
jgi:hypothetical protein